MDPKPVEPTPFDVSAAQPSEAVEPEIVTADPLQAVRAELAQLHARDLRRGLVLLDCRPVADQLGDPAQRR